MKSNSDNRAWLRQWYWEIFSLCGCLAIFVAMIALLVHFDGRSPFDWHGITLNAIISILSVVIKTWIIFSISQCVSQWNWILFYRGQRRLIEFERIDQASRGPMGSFDVMWRPETP